MYNQKFKSGLIATAGVITSLLIPTIAHANTITNFTTQFNTDWTSAGYGGMRGIGSGNINLTGVTGSVTKSYLYWHGPTNTTDPLANASITFASTPITGTNIGFADNNFWGFLNSQAYRADVTNLVTGDGNYSLANFVKGPNVEINGVSLLVFYNDGNTTNNRDVVLFDGNDGNFASIYDPAGWDANLSGINYTSGIASLVTGVSDGQNFSSNDDGTLRVNGATIASGGLYQGSSVPNGSGGPSNGGLWDIRGFDVTSSLSPGVNSLNVTLDAGFSDALSLIYLAVDLPAGSAPPLAPTTPEPNSILSLLSLGLIGAGTVWKRKNRMV